MMKSIMSRESLFDISFKVSETEYRSDPAYSYSTIAKFGREGFDKLHSLYDKIDTPSLLFGSMVDTLLTDGQEVFNNRYLVAEFPNISDTMISICNKAFALYSDDYRDFNNIPDEYISSIGRECDFWANSKWDNVRAKKIKEQDCNTYYNILFLGIGKTVVSNIDYIEAQRCVDILKNHRYTKFYFANNNPFDSTIERFYQLKFKAAYNDIPLRCMMDLVLVNHETKEIIPCDLKTSFKQEWYFFKSFIDWLYVIQAQLYWWILRENLNNHPIYKDYKLLPYRFIVISRGTKKPLVWEFKQTMCELDFVYGKDKKTIPNWRKLVTDLDYYLKYKPEYPIGITNLNDIEKWLNNE